MSSAQPPPDVTYPPGPYATPPPTKPWFKRKLAIVGFAIVGILALTGLVSLGGETTPTTAVPAPTVTVSEPAPTKTVTEPAPDPSTKTEEVTKEVTPQSCLDALNAADDGFTLAGEGFEILSDTLDAASRLDVDAINATTEKMKKINKKLEKVLPRYTNNREECRAAAE